MVDTGPHRCYNCCMNYDAFVTTATTMKPMWHTGTWSEQQTQHLIAELRLAQHTRSLTHEEQSWLKAAEELKTAQ